MIPSERGMQGGPEPITPSGVGPLDAECRGAASVVQLSGSRRVFAGTRTKLYELAGTIWNDVSDTGGYTGSSENRWGFAQFGNATIATNDTEAIQASTAGAFAAIATAPKARIVISVANFLIAFNTNDATYGDSPDRWWCSGLNDHTIWTPSVATQSNTGRLVDGGGEITAAARLGSQAIAFKENAMYVGDYAGSPVVWQWNRIPGDVGCVGPEAVCDLGGNAIAFAADDNFYIHDGTRPVAIGTKQVRQWFYDNSAPNYRYRTMAAFDRQNSRVWFMFPGRSTASGECDTILVYHLTTQQWGRADRKVEAPLNFASPGLTYDGIGALYATWDDLPDIPYDSQFWQSGGRVFSLFDATHQLQNMVGTSAHSSFTTGDFGEDSAVTGVNRVRLRFLTKPTRSTCSGYIKQGEGDPYTFGASGILSDSSAYDMRQSGRWHRLTFFFDGPVEVNGIKFDSTAAGTR